LSPNEDGYERDPSWRKLSRYPPFENHKGWGSPLDDLKKGQDKSTEDMVDTKEAIVSAQNSSKDAIVQAILTLKS